MTTPIAHPRIWTITMLSVAALVTASCGASPTSPSVVATGQTTALSGRSAVVLPKASVDIVRLNFSVDLTVPAYPVCPLTPPSAGELKGTGVLTVLLRTILNENGMQLGSTIRGHGTATDATGGSWVWTDADLNNELFASGNTSPNSFTQTIHEGFHVIGPKGQQIKVIGTFHLTMVDGVAVVEVEHGTHEEAETCESGFALTPLP